MVKSYKLWPGDPAQESRARTLAGCMRAAALFGHQNVQGIDFEDIARRVDRECQGAPIIRNKPGVV